MFQNVCQQCADHIAGKYIDNLLYIVQQMDQYNVCNDAVVGLLKGNHYLKVFNLGSICDLLYIK